MSLSEILNICLGGGLVALILAMATMRATIREANAKAEKARAEAEQAKADAEAVRITNAGSATRVLMENIVKPLKEELRCHKRQAFGHGRHPGLDTKGTGLDQKGCRPAVTGCRVRKQLSSC